MKIKLLLELLVCTFFFIPLAFINAFMCGGFPAIEFEWLEVKAYYKNWKKQFVEK